MHWGILVSPHDELDLLLFFGWTSLWLVLSHCCILGFLGIPQFQIKKLTANVISDHLVMIIPSQNFNICNFFLPQWGLQSTLMWPQPKVTFRLWCENVTSNSSTPTLLFYLLPDEALWCCKVYPLPTHWFTMWTLKKETKKSTKLVCSFQNDFKSRCPWRWALPLQAAWNRCLPQQRHLDSLRRTTL